MTRSLVAAGPAHWFGRHPRFNTRDTLAEHLARCRGTNAPFEPVCGYERYVVARNQGPRHELCQAWSPELEQAWQRPLLPPQCGLTFDDLQRACVLQRLEGEVVAGGPLPRDLVRRIFALACPAYPAQ